MAKYFKTYNKTCVVCGKQYTAERYNSLYCNEICKYKTWKKRKYKQYLECLDKQKGRITHSKKCPYCSKEFTTRKSYQKYCSKDCAQKMNKKQYESGKWIIPHHVLRFKILARDKFTCQYCGRNPREHGVTLHVDHIKARRKGGSHTSENLIAVCENCNLGKTDRDYVGEITAYLNKSLREEFSSQTIV